MLLIAAAAALVTSAPAPPLARATAQATATIRIMSGETVSFLKPQSGSGGLPLRDTVIRGANQAPQPARIIEFE
jgi:hypothetical protein